MYVTKMLRVTNSYIVVHSGWKEYNNLEQMKALFRLYNLEDYAMKFNYSTSSSFSLYAL